MRRIEQLDVATDYREIASLFYADFSTIMLPLTFNNFMMTFAAPRIATVLASTGEIEHRAAKRVVDMFLLTSAVMEHGLDPGPGRDAARRVNAMQTTYDIHSDDFVVVGCDAVVTALDLADAYGWRRVTDKEREAVRAIHSHVTRARVRLPTALAADDRGGSPVLVRLSGP